MSWLGRLAARRGAATVQWAPLGGGCGGDRAERESGAVVVVEQGVGRVDFI
jgi:hypothetical protein